MINSMMLHSFQDNAGIRVNGSSKNMLAHVLLSLLVFEHGFIQIRFSIFEFFARYFFNSVLHGIISLRTQFLIFY